METEEGEKLNPSDPSSPQPGDDSVPTTTEMITEIDAEPEEFPSSKDGKEPKREAELNEPSPIGATAIESQAAHLVLPHNDASAPSEEENMDEPGGGGAGEETELTPCPEIEGEVEVVEVACKEEAEGEGEGEGEGKCLVGSDEGWRDGEGGVSSGIDDKDSDIAGKEEDEAGNLVADNVKDEDLSTRDEERSIDEEIGSGSVGEVVADVAVEGGVMREEVNAVEEVSEGMERENDLQVADVADGSKEAEEERAAKSEVAEMVDEMEVAGETEVVKEEMEKDAEGVDEMEVADAVEGGDKEVEEEMEPGEEVEMVEQEEKVNEGDEMEMVEEAEQVGSGKRKRGKSGKANLKALSRKKTEEDVCFICFDGGELVLCDRRGCPKAYHPSCVNRDDAFFRSKGRWNCGLIYTTVKLTWKDLC